PSLVNAASTRTIQAKTIDGLYSADNMILNAGAEYKTKGWTASGGTLAASTSSPDKGSYVLTWDSNDADQTLMSASVLIPDGLKGKSGVLSVPIKCASSTCTHVLSVYDGTNEISATTIASDTSKYARTTINFGSFPTSGNLRMRLRSVASDEPSISVGEGILGDAF